MSQNSVALYVLKALKQERINHVFLVPGYNIDPFVENHPEADIDVVVAAHEGGAAFMADGYARASQGFGVCVAMGGPGVTNMVTAIAAAYADRSPVLVLSGSLSSKYTGDGVFQDSSSTGVDDIEIMRPITAWAQRVPHVFDNQIEIDDQNDSVCYTPEYNKAKDLLHKAIQVMRSLENQPAFLSFPREMLNADYQASYQSPGFDEPVRLLDRSTVQQLPDILNSATRIVIFAGNGCVRSKASKELQEFAEKYSIPVVTTLRAKGVLSEDPSESPMSFGIFGNGGTLQANKLVMGAAAAEGQPEIPKAEVLLVLGATLNETEQ